MADRFVTDRELLERGEALAALDDAFAGVAATERGSVALVAGEAGVGKTSLLRRFRDDREAATRLLWGDCDALFTPRPLGPLLDVAAATGGALEALVGRGATPHEVAGALLGEIGAHRPTVIVLEDVHWADEATLDVLRLVARRIDTAPGLVIATYRDELERAHPFRILLGELTTLGSVRRVRLEPLSLDAVSELATPFAVDPGDLHRATGGNPFYVTEVLAARGDGIPATVKDAVLARAARLDEASRALLEAVAIVPHEAELWLLEALVPAELDRAEDCIAAGMLAPAPGAMRFRHELARLAVEETLPPPRRLALHRAAVTALGAPPDGAPDLARLAHHAEEARDTETVLRVAPAAGAYAAAVGAHREAAAQYARALRFADGTTLDVRAELLENRAYECHLTEQHDAAIDAQQRALECRRALGAPLAEADALRRLSRMLWFAGQTGEADDVARRAVAVLERLPPGRELALAQANLAQLAMNAEDLAETRRWGMRARRLAARLQATDVEVHALNSVGTVELLTGDDAGRKKLERSLALARQEELEYDVARAFAHLTWGYLRMHAHERLEAEIDDWLDHTSRRNLDLTRSYLLACRAFSELERGLWAEAGDRAALLLGDPSTSPLPRVLALVVLALVRARRGDPGVWPLLDEAQTLAVQSGELQRIAPVASARAEACWLAGRLDAVKDETAPAMELALERRAPWPAGELACWRRRAGIAERPPEHAAEPHALELAGAWEDAAAWWAAAGCPYEAALARAGADDESALREALAALRRLGAVPAATIVGRRLRERGARDVPRGPQAAARDNAANLTPRQQQVLELVSEGLRNREIGERLFLSTRTVDHHVAAILRKLEARTRSEAVRRAARLGIVRDEG